ncbi:MAG: flagellar basal body P-ring formation chaperone FlgA [Aquabacterium sp.]
MRLLLATWFGVMACCSPWAAAAEGKAAPPSWQARVQAAAGEHIRQQAEAAGWREAEVDAHVVDQALRDRIPACSTGWTVTPLRVDTISRMRFALGCAALPAWRQEVVVRGTVSAEVLVSSTAIKADEPLLPDMLTLARRDVTATPDALADMDAVAGQSLRRAVRAGQIVRADMLRPALLVWRRQAVTIQARRAGIEVTQAGEALDNGRKGELIRVRNVASGKVIQARVIESGVVEPVGMPGETRIQSPARPAAD